MAMNDATNNSRFDWFVPYFVPHSNGDQKILEQWGFIPGIPELLMLRQVHALEHATVWILSSLQSSGSKSADGADDLSLGGLSTERGFFLYGSVNQLQLKQAVKLALTKLKRGEWNLALHPRCGTNASVSALLTTGAIFTSYAVLPKDPFVQLLGMGVAGMVTTWVAPDIGMSVQRYLTTAIPFNLHLDSICQTKDKWGRPAHFIRLQWQN